MGLFSKDPRSKNAIILFWKCGLFNTFTGTQKITREYNTLKRIIFEGRINARLRNRSKCFWKVGQQSGYKRKEISFGERCFFVPVLIWTDTTESKL